MAHTVQQRKRIRQDAVKTEARKAQTSRLRTYVKKFEEAIAAGDKAAIKAAFVRAMQELHQGVRRGLVKKETAGRKISRLSARMSTKQDTAVKSA